MNRHMIGNIPALYASANLDMSACQAFEGSAEDLTIVPDTFKQGAGGLFVPSGAIARYQTVAEWIRTNGMAIGAVSWSTKNIDGLHERIHERPVEVSDAYAIVAQDGRPAGYFIQTVVENGLPSAFNTEALLQLGAQGATEYLQEIRRVDAQLREGDTWAFAIMGGDRGVYHKMGFTPDFVSRNQLQSIGTAKRALHALALTHTR